MTEASSILTTNSFSQPPHPIATLPPSASPVLNGTVSDSNLLDEEEYTINCICIYDDDDGYTVSCEKCETWQHVECYYPGKKEVPDIHYCVDCSPRELDGRKATERQRRTREHLEGGDRKVKKPAKTSKKNKKENSASDLTNGYHHEQSDSISNGRDQPPPAKKPKTTHRTSGSVVSLNGDGRKRAYSNLQSYPSPSRSPQDVYRFPVIPQYSTEFLDLYDRDEGRTDAPRSDHTPPAANRLSQWQNEPSMVVNGIDQQPTNKAPFVRLSDDMERMTWPRVSLETSQKADLEVDGRRPTWRFLRLQQNVSKDAIIGEIRGQVGTLEEWCQQPVSPNRWSELLHPDPFVFFHPHMNIYIDSRRQGTQFRYLRRSCQPNVTLKTFVGADGQARHCFVANRDIVAGTELTAAWYINPSMFDMNTDSEDPEQSASRRCDWISRVLANFGDCACDNSQCPWARFDRRSSIKSMDGSTKSATGRKRKAKSKQALSPLSTGQATNSRAGSEAVKAAEEDDHSDRRSNSGSTHSGAPSRDLTPVNVAMLDADPILGSGLTKREMRKLQALESQARKREKATTDPKRKKVRTSGGPKMGTPNPDGSKQSPTLTETTQFSVSPQPVRDGVRKAQPLAHTSRSLRPVYVDCGTQTCVGDVPFKLHPSLQGLRYEPPHKRLLRRIKADREKWLARQKESPDPAFVSSPSVGIDVEMKDAGSAMSPLCATSSAISPGLRKMSLTDETSMTLPSQAAHTVPVLPPVSTPRLNLSTLPPVPTFPVVNTYSTPMTTAGSQTLSVNSQSPPSSSGSGSFFPVVQTGVIAPSPVKKKLSLGDYTRRRNLAATPTSEKPPLHLGMDGVDGEEPRRNSSTAESEPGDAANVKQESTAADDVIGVAKVDVTATAGASDREGDHGPSDPSSITTNNHLPRLDPTVSTMETAPIKPEVAGVLAHLAQLHQSSEQARSQPAGSSG